MNQQRKRTIKGNELSKIVTYSLSGYPQRVLIDGKNKRNPLLLFLHGGPGAPFPFSVGCRGMFPALTEQFTMVYWDQLGSGINNHKIDDSFSIAHYISMTIDLLQCLRQDYPECDLNLFAVSWGSVLAAEACKRAPRLIKKAFIYGQIMHDLISNRPLYQALASSLPHRKLAQLHTLQAKPEKTPNDFQLIAQWIRKYTEGFQCKAGGRSSMGHLLWGLLNSPDYRLRDVKATVVNGTQQNQSLLRALLAIDLRDTLSSLNVPYFIIQGEKDLITATALVTAFVEHTHNPNLQYCTLENNSHLPGDFGMKRILEMGFAFLQNNA